MMEWFIIVAAGFTGGALNAVAGGGSFITLPALIFAGLTPLSANATGTAALLPGYIASAWRFRKDMVLPSGLSWAIISVTAMVGGCVGAVTLLMTSERLFSVLIPWLILAATAMFFFGPAFLEKMGPDASEGDERSTENSSVTKKGFSLAILLAVCIYGGYFNGGLGIIVLAALGLMGQQNLTGMNGVKNFISAVLTVIAVAVYAAGEMISLFHLMVLGGAAVAGGYAGAAASYRVSQKRVRAFVILVGLVMALIFFMQ